MEMVNINTVLRDLVRGSSPQKGILSFLKNRGSVKSNKDKWSFSCRFKYTCIFKPKPSMKLQQEFWFLLSLLCLSSKPSCHIMFTNTVPTWACFLCLYCSDMYRKRIDISYKLVSESLYLYISYLCMKLRLPQ